MAIDKINLNNLDKSGWKTYRFDEIAQNISERIDPNNTDLEVYIGLEHIDSESLHIKRFGSPDDVSGQKLKFYKVDIIAGICHENGWHFILGFEPDEEEDLTDLERKLSPPIPYEAVKFGRNDPCVCGSGKKYKKCCGPRNDSPVQRW